MPRNAYKQIDVSRSIRNRALCRLGQVPNSTSQHFQERALEILDCSESDRAQLGTRL